MWTMTALDGEVRDALARLNPIIGDVVEGFWIT